MIPKPSLAYVGFGVVLSIVDVIASPSYIKQHPRQPPFFGLFDNQLVVVHGLDAQLDLVALGVDDADDRVLVAPALAQGITGNEGEQAYIRALVQDYPASSVRREGEVWLAAAGPAPARSASLSSAGSSATPMLGVSANRIARSITFSSSRMLPGQP